VNFNADMDHKKTTADIKSITIQADFGKWNSRIGLKSNAMRPKSQPKVSFFSLKAGMVKYSARKVMKILRRT